LTQATASNKAGKSQPEWPGAGIGYAFIGIMFLIIIGGALTLSSAVTLAFMAFRAPEAYETEQGLQVIRRIPKQRSTSRLTGALAQAR
jgi:hypothetical protein